MGALIDLWPRLKAPIYATPFAAALLEASAPGEPGAPKIPVNVVPLGGRLDARSVRRSTSSPSRIRFRNRMRWRSARRSATVLHTGDWKIDPTPVIGAPTDAARLAALGEEGVLALVGDSTNAIRDGRSALGSGGGKDACRADPRRAGAGRGHDIRLPCRGASAQWPAAAPLPAARWWWSAGPWIASSQVARETGYLDGVQEFRGAETYGYLPPDKVLALCTGSQGEPRAASPASPRTSTPRSRSARATA